MDKDNTRVIELGEKDLEDAIRGLPALVVDCYATWCPDCRVMAPLIEQLAADNKGCIVFAGMDMEHSQAVKELYQIMAVPTLLIFRDGRLVSRLVEPAPQKAQLQKELDRCFA